MDNSDNQNGSSSAINDETTMPLSTSSKVAEFVFENPITPGDRSLNGVSKSLYRNSQRTELETVKDFLKRPQRVGTFTWAATDAVGTTPFNIDLHNFLLTNPWNIKLAGFRWIRAKICLRVVLSASPTQQGALYCRFLPLENGSEMAPVYISHFRNLTQISQLPGVTLQTCHKEAYMEFPTRTPSGVIPLNNPSEEQFYLGKFNITILDTLRTGAGSITTTNISVYMHLDDVELGGPTVPQSGVTSRVSKVIKRRNVMQMEEDEANKYNGLVSGPSIIVSEAAQTLAGIPILTPIANSVSWFAECLAKASSAFGFSKPLSDSTETPMILQPHLSSFNCDGQEVSIVAATTRSNKIALMDDIPGHNEDEMSIDFIKKQFSYFKTVNITSASPTALDSTEIGPTTFNTNFTYTNASGPTIIPTRSPIGFLGTMFAYWKGSIKVRVRFIKTIFHSGTLAFSFVPAIYTGPLTDIDQSYVYTHYVDLSMVDEVTLELPYLVSSPWLPTRIGLPTRHFSGTLFTRIINPLKFPDNVSGTISCIYEVSGGDSLEFAVPTNKSGFNPVVAQSGIEADCMLDESNFDVAPQDEMICYTAGEKISSLRQLLKCFHDIAVNFPSATQPTFGSGTIIDPTTIAVSNSWPLAANFTSEGVGGDLFSQIAQCYLFQRGSIRYRWQGSGGNSVVNSTYDAGSLNSTTLSATTATNFPTTFPAFGFQQGWRILTTLLSSGGGSITYPYLSKFLYKVNVPIFRPLGLAPSLTFFNKYTGGGRSISWNLTPSSAVVDGRISRAIGEDFQFAYWLGVPPG